MTSVLEHRLNVDAGGPHSSTRIDLIADPDTAGRMTTALLLRKARIHTMAVLRANETSNLHSLAVQMRPVLECAGQVFFYFGTLMAAGQSISRRHAAEVVGARIDADHFRTLRRVTKGGISLEELREAEARAAAATVRVAKPTGRKRRRFTQADKVAPLVDGREWYTYLSEHFSHGREADWRGLSLDGGVMSVFNVEDEMAFLGLMSYLVEQVAVMNAAAVLCPAEGDPDQQWNDWVEPALDQLKHVRNSSKAFLEAAGVTTTGQPDEDARNG